MNPKYSDKDYQEKLVAFLDILGFKKLISQDKSESIKSINFMDERIKHILNVLQENHGKKFSIKLFSDCICLSCEYTFENLFYILYELSFIQLYFSFEGIFLKGALSKGEHFENERIIFSKGLIKAYTLEQVAIYPRIIIDEDLIDEINEDHNLYFPIYAGFKKKDFLIESFDGQFTVDYLNLLYEEGVEKIDEFKKHKRAILRNIKENHRNIRVIEKYRWVAEYHNYKFNEIIDKEDLEECYIAESTKEASINLKSIFPKFHKSQIT